MSVEFSNAYQEILLDNFNSVIKQNMMFQTQLKLAEEAQKNNKSEDKINLLNSEFNNLQKQYEDALKKISELEVRSSVGQSLHDEKTRIQAALNEESKKNASLNNNILEQTKLIEEQSVKITELSNELEKSNKEVEELKSTLEKKESMPTDIKTVLTKVKKTNSKVESNQLADGSSF
jgi:uncharacterized coiled-coil DUF342 family protein